MNFHLATNRAYDFEAIRRDAEAGECPRFFMGMLLRHLGGTAHHPGDTPVTAADRLRARVVGRPEIWAMARALAARLGPDDVVYCPGEDVGFPVAALCGGRRGGPRVVVYVHNVDRPRARAALRLFRLRDRVALFLSNIQYQLDFVRASLRLPESRTFLVPEQTDLRFFTPGPPSEGKARPVVAGVGLEQRDYRTLARATADLDVDVRISAFSKDAVAQARAFPEELPANMSRRFYSWPELVQLYRDADVVAITLFPCKYAAGITTLGEAMACCRPVVADRTVGLADYLTTPGTVEVTPTGDPDALRRAIVGLLEDRDRAGAMAREGRAMALSRLDSDRRLEEVAGRFAELAPGRDPSRRDALSGATPG